SEEDPEIAKVKGAFWRRAGQLQAAVGNLAGIDSWETAGRSTEGWANDVYQSAAERSANGEPSRVHGEYNRMMGILEQTVGHIAGDPEMEAKAGQRTRQAEEEI
ncbi:uncharacterized protein BYT42DRAFT_477930, partial [Radiomyces spectabilis]|uniref:uncharacterized protein n=1 Tax=Radiomyces spectabilis TaxID=64574 RepID=UPI00222019D7